MLLISNGRVIDPASGSDAPRDILLDGGRIAAVAPQGQLATRARGAEIIDAANFVVAPGFIDLHCHLREPGGESSETIETGTRAAARGVKRALLVADLPIHTYDTPEQAVLSSRRLIEAGPAALIRNARYSGGCKLPR